MTDKQKQKSFDYVTISQTNPTVQKLLSNGKKRFHAIEENDKKPKYEKISDTALKSGGIVLAREAKTGGEEQIPCITDDVHTLTIGGTGCGKTRCLVLQSICALALAGEGIVVNDPKGEIYHYTHTMLENLGYNVKVMDFQDSRKSDHYNPLQIIIDAVNDGRIDDAQTFAWDLVTFLVEKNDHSEPIWSNGEMAVVSAAILCVVYDNQDHPEYQNLTNVYHFISEMCKTENKEMPLNKYMAKLPYDHPARALMAIAKIAPDRMGGSFYTSALATLRLFVSNDVYRITSESEFALDDFGKENRQALFFILPDQKTTFYPIVTLLVSQQYEQLVTYAKKHGNRLPHRVNYVLDEFGNFAAIADFDNKLTVSRGYGIRWNLFLQDFNQLTNKYSKEISGIIKGNCRYWIYLQSSDYETNEEISKRMGSYTTSTYSLGGSTQKYAAPSSSTNIQLSQRNLLDPAEVGRFQRPYQLVISNEPPAVMNSPDISQWSFNKMLGLGDKDHNKKLIEQDESNRPNRGEKATNQLIWKPWEALKAESEGQQTADSKPPQSGVRTTLQTGRTEPPPQMSQEEKEARIAAIRKAEEQSNGGLDDKPPYFINGKWRSIKNGKGVEDDD